MINLNAKYRPTEFKDVVGQNVATEILSRMLYTRNLKNCLAFVGASGCGKTSTARIMANKINHGCGSPIQIDAASNNGVENIRAIVESANHRAIDCDYKVYIIDEAHMLTTAAWNAFLKTIEEPPEYTIFIFCTTEPNKIPDTIMNRVQRYNFAKIDAQGIYDRLVYICQQEGFANYEVACDFIAKASRGSMRSAITALEQCACLSTTLSLDNAKAVLGELSCDRLARLTSFIRQGDEASVLMAMEVLAQEGADFSVFVESYLQFAIDVVKYILFKDISLTNLPTYLQTTEDAAMNIKTLVSFENSLAWFNTFVDRLFDLKVALKGDTMSKSTVQVALARTCRGV